MDTINGYKILETLSQSPKAIIYRGLRLSDNVPIILKCPNTEHPSLKILADLQHEYFLLKQLSIPGVIKPYGLIQQGLHTVLVLEDFNGQTFTQLFTRKANGTGSFLSLCFAAGQCPG